ncbi:MAG: BamA/TamA family outer membrane protein, partial [Candidatus Coatesbacteria bacterium]|nr:BamA/TamA family outer membrane protein [Candidatus Coatesbacteria bacterium]
YMGNLEWRFPLLDYIALGLPVGDLTFYEVQGALFFDVGAAWNAEETVPDPVGDFGVGFRVGLGPYLALRFDLAWLTDFNSVERDAEFGFYIGWNY